MNPDTSYIMLSESQLPPEASAESTNPSKRQSAHKKAQRSAGAEKQPALSQRLETAHRLFEILSARSDIDHPICSECTELVLDSLQKKQATVVRERDAYVDFLKGAQEDVPTEGEQAKTKRDLDQVQRREREALADLEALEAEKAKMEQEIVALDREAEELDKEEHQFWLARNSFVAELSAFQDERDSLQNRLTHDTKLLESLQRTNVYNDTFPVSHDGMYGTINGLRLGRLPDHPVEWTEINAALGQDCGCFWWSSRTNLAIDFSSTS